MRIGLVTERIQRDDATQPQPEDILRETTRGGAQALRQQAAIGSLEVGKKADLIVVDTQRSHLVPTLRIVSAWLHNGQPGDIEAMMVDGKFLMRDRQVLTLDEASLIQEAEKIGRRAWNQLLKRYPSAQARGASPCSGAVTYPELCFMPCPIVGSLAHWSQQQRAQPGRGYEGGPIMPQTRLQSTL